MKSAVCVRLCVRDRAVWNFPVCPYGGTRGFRQTDFKYLKWELLRECTSRSGKPFLVRNRYVLCTGAMEPFHAPPLAAILMMRLWKISLFSCGIFGGRRTRNRYALRGHRGTLFRATIGDNCHGAAVENMAF